MKLVTQRGCTWGKKGLNAPEDLIRGCGTDLLEGDKETQQEVEGDAQSGPDSAGMSTVSLG